MNIDIFAKISKHFNFWWSYHFPVLNISALFCDQIAITKEWIKLFLGL